MHPLLPRKFFRDEIDERQLRILHACQDAGAASRAKRALVAILLLVVALALGGPRLALWYAGQRLINALPLMDDARRWDETVNIKPECGAIWIQRGYVTEQSEQQIIDFFNAHRERFPTGALNPGYGVLVGHNMISVDTWSDTGDGKIIRGNISIIHPKLVDNNDPIRQASLAAQREGKTFFTTNVLYVNNIDRYDHGPCFHD